jgi:hypothetical protein
VQKVDKCYRAMHDQLCDFLAYYFGGNMPELIIEHAQSDLISDIFLWETKDNRTKNIVYTIIITDEHIRDIHRKNSKRLVERRSTCCFRK